MMKKQISKTQARKLQCVSQVMGIALIMIAQFNQVNASHHPIKEEKSLIAQSETKAKHYGVSKKVEAKQSLPQIPIKKEIITLPNDRPINAHSSVGPRPSAWCGWYMRTLKGGGVEYNRAKNWANRGKALDGPKVGAVVVWPHHVGVITKKANDGKWFVLSGNDSNRVRERARTLDGAIAFRDV